MRELKVYCPGEGTRYERSHSDYAKLSGKAGVTSIAHHLMWETWVGPRKKTDANGVKWEIDHINGDTRNWSLDNLEEITAAENYRRRKILHRLRKEGKDPTQMPIAELKRIFNLSTNKQL